MSQVQKTKFIKKILIGTIKDGDAVAFKIEYNPKHKAEYYQKGRGNYTKNEPSFNFGGEGFSLQFYDDNSGESYAREYVDEDYMWKDAVQDGRTELGFEEWKQEILDNDSWQDIIGDMVEAGEGGNGEMLYVRWSSSGGINKPSEFDELVIDKKHLKEIYRIGKKLNKSTSYGHAEFKKEEYKLLERLIEIFSNYPEFKTTDLRQFVTVERLMKE